MVDTRNRQTMKFKNYALISVAFFHLFLTNTMQAQDFVHPGIFNRESDYARMRQKVAEKAEPWYSAWKNLLASPEAQLSWSPRATATVIRGGTGDNISLMYRDVAAAYQHALIYKISGDIAHASKAVQILNSWSAINKVVSGNADRYLASGLNGYQWANAAEMMRGYPGFDVERFKNYLLNVFYFPMNERFLLGNDWGASHNDACATNYRVNWDICNMNAMMAISIFCDYKDGYEKVLQYCKTGDGTGNIYRAVNFIHSPIWGQWEESGRDQGHATGGLSLYGLFCEIAWNQGTDLYSFNDSRIRKGAEYVARYNIMTKDIGGATVGKYNDLPYTSYSRQMGSNCSWYTESSLGTSVRGKYGSCWEMFYNHYARRMNQGDKVSSIYEILQQQPSTIAPSVSIHADTYDTPGLGALTFRTDSAGLILPWSNMDINARSIVKLPVYGRAAFKDSALTVKGSGTGIKGYSDQFHFVYQKLVDNGSLIAKITSLDEVNALCQAGLMIRETLEQNSTFAFIGLSTAQGALFSMRDSIGKMAKGSASKMQVQFPYWIQLKRNGDSITASFSGDRANWAVMGSVEIKMSRLVFAGIAVSSNTTDSICSAVFDQIQVVQGNVRPIVNLSSPKNSGINYVSPATIQVSGTTYDLENKLDRTDIYLNDSLVSTSKNSPYNFLLTGVKEGNYTIYVKGYDLSGANQVSDKVPIAVNAPSEKLPWYTFNEPKAGLLTADSSGNLLFATLTGNPIIVAGKIGNALSFDGVDDYVRMPTSFIQKLSDFSISMWINPTANTTWARIFDFGQDTNNYMMLTVSNGTGLTFEIKTNQTVQKLTTNRLLPLNSWSHVAVTLSDNTLTLYLNGSVIGKNTSMTLRPYNLGAIVSSNFLGKSLFSSDPYFSGKMDEVRIFNQALSSAEINAMVTLTGMEREHDKKPWFYPNPASNEIQFFGAEGSTLTIYNSMGEKALEHFISANTDRMDISSLATGIYLLRSNHQNNIGQLHVLIKK